MPQCRHRASLQAACLLNHGGKSMGFCTVPNKFPGDFPISAQTPKIQKNFPELTLRENS